MRTSIAFFFLSNFAAFSLHAQWAVIDAANLTQSVTNYAVLTEQLTRQATQITNQVKQIQQFETQLTRAGDMAAFKHLIGYSQFRLDLELPTQMKPWSTGLIRVDGRGIFGDNRAGMYPAVPAQFSGFDGVSVTRDASLYKPSQDIVSSVDEFKSVQGDVYKRRVSLKEAIDETSAQLQDADTSAEQQKLSSLLTAQYGELAAVDSEIALSAAEIQVKMAESAAMDRARETADSESRGQVAQEEVSKVPVTFKPSYECMLQFVTEKSLSK